jgi:hypothetical protein
MKSYLTFLLQDLKKAHRASIQDPVGDAPKTFLREMEAIEQWASGKNPPATFLEYSGLTTEQFPPPEKLTQEELATIVGAFHEMLATWNMQTDFPPDFPMERAYPLLIDLLKREAWYLPGGTLHFDFCTGYAPDCVLKEYCSCKKYWDQEDCKTVRQSEA